MCSLPASAVVGFDRPAAADATPDAVTRIGLIEPHRARDPRGSRLGRENRGETVSTRTLTPHPVGVSTRDRERAPCRRESKSDRAFVRDRNRERDSCRIIFTFRYCVRARARARAQSSFQETPRSVKKRERHAFRSHYVYFSQKTLPRRCVSILRVRDDARRRTERCVVR